MPTTLASMADDAVSVLDHLGWPDAHVVGHSLGGVVALEMADRAPDRVRSLSLLCSFLKGRIAGPSSPSKIWTALRTTIGTPRMRRRAFYNMVSDPALPVTDERIALIERAFGRRLEALPAAAMRQLFILLAADMSEAATRWTGPAWVLSASDDSISPPSEGARLAEALGVLPEVMTGGHAVPVQRAEFVNERLRTFLQSARG